MRQVSSQVRWGAGRKGRKDLARSLPSCKVLGVLFLGEVSSAFLPSNSELTPQTVKPLQINAEKCKGKVGISIVRSFLCTLSGDGAAHDDGLHLPPWFCDGRVARPAHHVAWSPSPHFLLAGLHTSGAPRPTHFGRDGPVDARHHHGVALWTLAQSRVLERDRKSVV